MIKITWGVTRHARHIAAGLMSGHVLDVDLVNMWQHEGESWGETMDWSQCVDNDPYGPRKRNYLHVVISPDDDISLVQLKEIANAWVQEFFGWDYPKICTAEAAIVYHDDNTCKTKHAHIVVNNLDLFSGRSIKIDREQWYRMTKYL